MTPSTLTPTNTAYQLAVENAASGIECYYPAGNTPGDYDHTMMQYLRKLVQRGFTVEYLNDECTEAFAVKPATETDPVVNLILKVVITPAVL